MLTFITNNFLTIYFVFFLVYICHILIIIIALYFNAPVVLNILFFFGRVTVYFIFFNFILRWQTSIASNIAVVLVSLYNINSSASFHRYRSKSEMIFIWTEIRLFLLKTRKLHDAQIYFYTLLVAILKSSL